jgi:ribosome maturation protein Sdo1
MDSQGNDRDGRDGFQHRIFQVRIKMIPLERGCIQVQGLHVGKILEEKEYSDTRTEKIIEVPFGMTDDVDRKCRKPTKYQCKIG